MTGEQDTPVQPQPAGPAEELPKLRLPVLHLDDDLIIVSKPSGMLMHRDEHAREATVVVQTVRDQLGGRYVYPVARLDRSTSGIVAMALSSRAAALLQRSLASADTEKIYLALVRGVPMTDMVCTQPLANRAGDGQPACTHFTVLKRFGKCALLSARLMTGRYHQIRRHLNHLRLHVAGDSVRGKARFNRFFRTHHGLHRLFLHATRLTFQHPIRGDRLTMRDPLPAELLAVLRGIPGFEPGLEDRLLSI